ncbi:MAG: sigma-54-dependent Fis family transcriptional regulator [Magnetococcales bacterium]|nr:sigma-54-dependent Fis family transcriptional regulator [Magnetococcales bacterium]
MNQQIQSHLPVILVDDEREVLFSSSYLLKSSGIPSVITMSDGSELLDYLRDNQVGPVVLDLLMPDISGLQLLPEIVARFPQVPVIVMTASQEVEKAVQCMKIGAFDYLVKPVEEIRFISSVKRALEVLALRQHTRALRQSLLQDDLVHAEAFRKIITRSRLMNNIFHYVEALSSSPEPVLITGETGVGKELIADALHNLSNNSGRLVSLNIAGLDDTLFSDTLFGHAKNAFTNANTKRKGLITQAHNGTLFLDEIGDLETQSQLKLLRLLQEKNYFPLGSDVAKTSTARIVSATNQNLYARMKAGEFRADLYYRLTSHLIEIPPLRERREDIPLLVGHFLKEAGEALNKPNLDPPNELLTLLSTYHFSGNIRELRAMIYDSVTRHTSGTVISMESCRQTIQRHNQEQNGDPSLSDPTPPNTLYNTSRFPTLKEAENSLIDEAMIRANSNQGIAALLLGISRPALNRRLMKMKQQPVDE